MMQALAGSSYKADTVCLSQKILRCVIRLLFVRYCDLLLGEFMRAI